MYIPNIPSVSTSVVDRSSIAVTISGKRSILLPGFFKYGKEGFTIHKSVPDFIYNSGREDIKKYGNAYLYAKAAATNNTVISYRLLPSDATYSNNAIKSNGDFEAFSNITSKEQLYLANPDIVLSGLAANRGEGYNNIFITFEPAITHEKMDANSSGESNYKFNFVQAEVYEETVNGVKSLGDPVVFSLIEVDPVTNEPVIDKFTGNNLFINSIFKDANQFSTLMVNPDFTDELSTYANIDKLTDSRLIVEDRDVAGKYYEVKVESYTRIEQDANGVNIRIPDTRLTTVITNIAPKVTPVLTYTDTNGATLGQQIVITNSVISFEPVAPSATAKPFFYLDGASAFYKLEATSSSEIIYSEVQFLRHTLYRKLMSYSMKLYAGSDGENLHINGRLNMNGPSAPGKENPLELLLNFYNNTEELREVLYPVYDFDYIPDWSENVRVQTAIINLADDIGLTMPIISCPLSYNPAIVTKDLPEKDLATRKEQLFQSSYNAALYSGQINKTHRTDSNLRMYMPLSYYAMVAHLKIDNNYSITEPVANMIKGTLDSTSMNLTYAPTSLQIEALRNEQINTVIVEPDGTYIIDQLTMYKKASKLSRINVVKVLHRIRKDLPRLLKDLIQTKANTSVIETAIQRTNKELSKWVSTPENIADGIFSSATVNATFNEETYKLRLTITVNPIGTLESIDIPIIVV